jgi:hypothetical protein
MLLDIGKMISFIASLIALSRIAISAFFTLGTRWQQRLWLMLPDMAIAVCVCLVAGMVFRWPTPSNPESGKPLASSLPIQMMLWTIPGIAALFSIGWYLVCGNPLSPNPYCR